MQCASRAKREGYTQPQHEVSIATNAFCYADSDDYFCTRI